MKTLKERQADRAARKFENRAAADVDNTGTDRIGVLSAQMAAVQAEAESLSPEDQAELKARLANGGEPTPGYAPAPTFPLAGIGVTNPMIGTAEEVAAAAEAGAAAVAWGETAPAETPVKKAKAEA